MASLFDLLGGAYGYQEQLRRLENLGADVKSTVGLPEGTTLYDTAINYGTFKPYTVKSATGTTDVNAQGGYTTTLTPEQEAFRKQLFGDAGTMFGAAAQGIQPRTQDIYNQMQAAMAPQQERERLALEERLASQGRLGVSTAQYGGTPDQLALAKAQQEAQSQAYLGARQAALGEQAQAATIGGQLLSGSYAPEAQLLNMLQPSVNLSNIATTAGGNVGGMLSELGMGGLTTRANIAAEKNDLLKQLLASISAGTAGMSADTGNQYADAALNFLFGKLGG